MPARNQTCTKQLCMHGVQHLLVAVLVPALFRSICVMGGPDHRYLLMSRSVSSTTMPVLRAVYISDPV